MDEDVTTLRMTPTLSMSAAPSPTLVVLNGGIRRIAISWDAGRPGRRLRGVTEPVIPNRCSSVSRCVCPRSRSSWREWDLPPPGAQGMCGRHPATATAVMGRLDRRRRRRECSEAPSPQTLNVPLDSQRFIDARRPVRDYGLASALQRSRLRVMVTVGSQGLLRAMSPISCVPGPSAKAVGVQGRETMAADARS